MRLLLVAEDVPNRWPEFGDGSSLISYELLRHLPRGIDVDLLTFARGIPVPEDVAGRCRSVELLPPRGAVRSAVSGALSAQHPGAIARRSSTSTKRVRELSRHADITLLHGPHVLRLAKDVEGPAVAQVVDPWSQRTRMDARMAPPLIAAHRRLRAARALSSERGVPSHVRLVTVSPADAEAWQRRLRREVLAIPNGIDEPGPGQVVRAPSPTVCLVGSLDYAPNVDSALRLVERVGPLVRRDVPDLRIVVAGRRPGVAVKALAGAAVDVLPDVPSITDVLRSSHVAVFPDRFGVGTRNSVQDALAAGLPVVATPVAARGLAPSPRLLVAADDAELAAAVVRALRDPSLAPAVALPPTRSWKDAVRDYVALLCATASSRTV